MPSIRYALSALAAASVALAQCSVDGTTTVGGEATQLGSCSTFSGSVALATDAPNTVDFGQLGSIDGDFIANQARDVQTITANSISNITGRFTMTNMSSLFTLDMRGLRGVGQRNQGGIFWNVLPLLQALNFGDGLDSAAAINIQNTQIQDLSSVNVKLVNQVTVANNPALSALNWGTTNCTNMTIGGNGVSTMGANITLDELEGVSSMSIRNASSLSLPSLANCEYLLAVESGGLEELLLPNLTMAGEGISVSNSPALTNVSLPSLRSSGGALKLVNNDKLSGDLKFPVLRQIRGDLNITGSFDSVQMPELNTIQGTSYLWSTEDIDSTCDQFGKGGEYAGSKIVGRTVCRSNSRTASAGSGTSGGDGSQSSSPAIPNVVAQPASLFGAAGLFAAMLGLM